MKISAFILIVFITINSSAFGLENDPNEEAKQIASSIDLLLGRAANFGFSGAFLYSKGGKVLLSKGYGYADRANKILIDSNTAFEVASITKPFTAVSILKLELAGKLKTSDTIGRFFQSVPPDKAEITIHHLLTHSSGLRDAYAATGIEDRSLAVQTILNVELMGRPGQQYNYSNDGYNLLAAIIEITSGKTYEEYVLENLLKPAGMINSGFWGETKRWPKGRVAHAYNRDLDNKEPQYLPATWGDRGAGNLITTVEDLHRWDQILKKDTILPGEAKTKMYTPYSVMSNGWHYGYGWSIVKNSRGTLHYYHGGGNIPRGSTAEFHRYIDENITTIILVNSMSDEVGFHRAVSGSIAGLLFGGSSPIPPPFSPIKFNPEKYQHTYKLPDGGRIIVSSKEGRLFAMAEGQDAIGNLMGYKKDINVDLEKLNKKVGSILDLAKNGKFSDALTDTQWQDLIKTHGAFSGYEILGTIPVWIEGNIFTTFARLQFEKSAEVYRWVWRKENSIGLLSGTPFPATMPLAPLIPEKFRSYDLLNKTGAILAFKESAGKLVLAIQSDYDSVEFKE